MYTPSLKNTDYYTKDGKSIRKPSVFISYAQEDIQAAQKLHTELEKFGADPWFDKEKLIVGQCWDEEIEKAIQKTDFFIALLSTYSVSKKGFVQTEMRRAFEVADQMPYGKIYIIPVRLDETEISHRRLKSVHWVDIFKDWDSGIDEILQAIDLKSRFAKRRRPETRARPKKEGTPSFDRRLQISLSDEGNERLKEIQERIGAENIGDVVRDALRIYDLLSEQSLEKGDRVLLSSEDGEETVIKRLNLWSA